MSARINPEKKDVYWAALITEHRAGRKCTMHQICRMVGTDFKYGFRMFRLLMHFGYVGKNERGEYVVLRDADTLPDDVRYCPIEPGDGVYKPRYPREMRRRMAGPKEPPAPRERKRKESPISATWRRMDNGVVTNAHRRPIPKREFHHRVIACAVCGDTTIDGQRHSCIGGWRMEADKCICPKCARRAE